MTVCAHRLVPVSKDIRAPSFRTVWRCVWCGAYDLPVDLTGLNLGSETMTVHMPLVLARADIRGSDGLTYTGVAIRALDGAVFVHDRGGNDLGGRSDVASVEQAAPGWAVTFANGDVWNVERGGCGCGGSV